MPRTAAPTGSQPQRTQASDQNVIALVDENYQHSLREHHTFYSQLSSQYHAYRTTQTQPREFRNNVNVPFIFAMVQSDVARKVQTSFGSWPIVSFGGYAPEDAGRARKNEVLISAQMKDDDSIVKAVDFFLTADLYGTAIARYGWRNITRKNRVRKMESIAP